MQTRLFGKTGEAVSVLGLGTCFMAGQGESGVRDCVHYAVDAVAAVPDRRVREVGRANGHVCCSILCMDR